MGFLINRDIPVEVLKAKYAGEPSQFIDIKGLEVHYRDQGRGPVLLCLHGMYSSLHSWEAWVKELSGRYRLIALDLPGFGLTGPAPFAYSKDNYIKFLNAFINKMALKEFYLVGNKIGAYYAWNYAIRFPNQVKKLVIIDAPGYKMPLPLPMRLIASPFGYFVKWIMPRFIFALNARELPERIRQDTVDTYYELMMRPGNREALRSLLVNLYKEFSSDGADVVNIKVPTLIMWGTKDRWVPLDFAERFHNDIKNSQLIMYDEAGHLLNEEIPEKTAMDVDRFFRQKE